MNIQDYRNVTDRLEVSEKCRDEVFNMNRERNISHRKIRKSTVIVIAAAIVACTGTATAFASGFGIFDNIMNSRSRTFVNENGIECKVDKFDYDDYSQVAEHAENAAEDKWYSNDELSVSVDRVYCDGRSLFVALKGYMTDSDTSDTDYISLSPQIRVGDKTFGQKGTEYDGCVRNEGLLLRDEGEADSFSGIVKFEFDDDNIITEKTDVEITLSGLSGSKDYYAGDLTFESAKPIIFTVSAEPDESLRTQTDCSFSEDGYEAKIYEISPAGIIIGTKNPGQYENNDETIDIIDSDGTVNKGPKYSLIALCFDENGNMLDFLPHDEPIDYNDGLDAGFLQATDSKTITVKWFNKQEQDDSTETGMKLYFEHTFDISENQ